MFGIISRVDKVLTFQALTLCQSEWIRSDKGLTLEMSALESLYGGQITFSNQLC